jgi:hypothetical protein
MLQTFQEFTSGGRPQGGSIPEDLRDFVENVSAKDRPVLSLFRKTKINSTFVEWQEDVLPARAFNAYDEGAEATDQALVTPTRTFAHTQQFARWGKVSDTQRSVEHKGFADAYLYQEKKAIDATLNDIEHALNRGSAASGETNVPRQLAGLLNVLSTNFTDASGVTLTEDVWSDLVQAFVDNGTEIRPSVALVNSWLKRTISQFNTKITRNIDAAARAQINVVEMHSSDFGDIRVFYDRDMLKSSTKAGAGNSLVLLDPSYFEIAFLTPLQSEPLAKTGLSTRFQISAECTLIYRTEKAGGGAPNVCSYIV